MNQELFSTPSGMSSLVSSNTCKDSDLSPPPRVMTQHIKRGRLSVVPTDAPRIRKPTNRSRPSTHQIPTPRYRHATPSGPWPFLDLRDKIPKEPIQRRLDNNKCNHLETIADCSACLGDYPQSLFPNWTVFQQKKSGIYDIKRLNHPCVLRYVEMQLEQQRQLFSKPKLITVERGNLEKAWMVLKEARTLKVKARIIFVDDISGPALKLLGSLYDVEPFFFSSSLGWIPSRFRESHDPLRNSDHITVTIRFIRKVPKNREKIDKPQPRRSSISNNGPLKIDVHKPFNMGNCSLHPDLLALHMIRSETENTIISYHCSNTYGSTSAEDLCTRLQLVGKSVYWSKMFENNPDPTFILISILWHALYAWDEAVQELQNEIHNLEAHLINFSQVEFAHDLHTLRAYLLHYTSLLSDFEKAIVFVKATPNPATESVPHHEEMKKTMDRECQFLLNEIFRLRRDCSMQESRLKNVIELGFNRVNIEDSKQMRDLTEASLRDSAAMKQIAYLTMVFLPASFMSAVFGMNVVEISPMGGGTLREFFATAIPLTVVTIWVIGVIQLPDMRRQTQNILTSDPFKERNDGEYKWSRLWWPVVLMQTSLSNKAENRRIRGLDLPTGIS
ncbi:hypothetical protein AX17_006872 [Amanita inopinata Kibby_2008]|nr:hypothetical protein AX17_006872 [Amanita inopinata Kibby_2008]